ncbi:TetR/AcrR family transcriptional regulator [Paenibacillus sp. GSMTC-2017]|uniref:TetR/AcrR family transcriptional regulator n=1 Tax=Paenibacillus sp. GSMTC-2017 TaxID=2794350 RepID=UPI0018D687D6|nr:TetR/AcrR family transcriptional regulator [Paenibacillus sp. GSMTC-2017]MBH5316388.1 TetR/AcrR family transcriptional regulator [Paenibacillus sp. GSMTC-2017]
MSKKKEDLRSLRTKTYLTNALLTLINDNTNKFETITVNMICEVAMVHRTTFYKYFEDKYHLLIYCVDSMQQKFEQYTAFEHLAKPFHCMFGIWDYKVALTILECLEASSYFKISFGNRMKKMVYNDLCLIEENGTIMPIPKEILVELVGNAISGLAIWWIQNNRDLTATEMDGYYNVVINTSIFERNEIKGFM